jgi:hypothetical protein
MQNSFLFRMLAVELHPFRGVNAKPLVSRAFWSKKICFGFYYSIYTFTHRLKLPITNT